MRYRTAVSVVGMRTHVETPTALGGHVRQLSRLRQSMAQPGRRVELYPDMARVGGPPGSLRNVAALHHDPPTV